MYHHHVLKIQKDGKESAKESQECWAKGYKEILLGIIDGGDINGNIQASNDAILLQMVADVPVCSKLAVVCQVLQLL